MNAKTTGIVAYIFPIGWLIAFFGGDKEGARFHLNQALTLWIAWIILNVINYLPLKGIVALVLGIIVLILYIFLIVCWVLGLVHAVKEEEKQLPILGSIQILK